MKQLLALLAVLPLAFALPQAPAPAAAAKQKTPAGCRALNTDAEFPSEDSWIKDLPMAFPVPKGENATTNEVDYKIAVTKYENVQDAVKFAAKHNLRLSVISSGHDFLGRNNAPSGLAIDVSNLGGITVQESFTPTPTGSAKPAKNANVIKPVAGKQAAVTIGAGITTQELNDALDKSGLVTVGAAHGSVSVAGGWVSFLN
jgi:FAD/FMN-containing dehydrogenase